MLKHNPKEVVEFSFMIRNTPRRFEIELDIAPEPTSEVTGRKTLKLFKSWFKLMKNHHKLLYGVLKFAGGETWLWQPACVDKHGNKHGGWQFVKPSRYEQKRELKREKARKQAEWENLILSTVGFTS